MNYKMQLEVKVRDKDLLEAMKLIEHSENHELYLKVSNSKLPCDIEFHNFSRPETEKDLLERLLEAVEEHYPDGYDVFSLAYPNDENNDYLLLATCSIKLRKAGDA